MKNEMKFETFTKALEIIKLNKNKVFFKETLLWYKDFFIVWFIDIHKKWNQIYMINATLNKKALVFLNKVNYKSFLFEHEEKNTIEFFIKWKNQLEKYLKKINLEIYWFEKDINNEIIESEIDTIDLNEYKEWNFFYDYLEKINLEKKKKLKENKDEIKSILYNDWFSWEEKTLSHFKFNYLFVKNLCWEEQSNKFKRTNIYRNFPGKKLFLLDIPNNDVGTMHLIFVEDEEKTYSIWQIIQSPEYVWIYDIKAPFQEYLSENMFLSFLNKYMFYWKAKFEDTDFSKLITWLSKETDKYSFQQIFHPINYYYLEINKELYIKIYKTDGSIYIENHYSNWQTFTNFHHNKIQIFPENTLHFLKILDFLSNDKEKKQNKKFTDFLINVNEFIYYNPFRNESYNSLTPDKYSYKISTKLSVLSKEIILIKEKIWFKIHHKDGQFVTALIITNNDKYNSQLAAPNSSSINIGKVLRKDFIKLDININSVEELNFILTILLF